MRTEKDSGIHKTLMEDLLKEQAEKSKLTAEYKILIDDMLEKHEKGTIEYANWEDFKKLVT